MIDIFMLTEDSALPTKDTEISVAHYQSDNSKSLTLAREASQRIADCQKRIVGMRVEKQYIEWFKPGEKMDAIRPKWGPL